MRLSLVTAALAASSFAQPSAQQAPEFPVHAVHIDVIASDARGDMVKGLKPADFELREDGVPRAVEGVTFGNPAPRLFAIFLDDYHVAAGRSASRAREALTRFFDQDVGPDDLVVVMKPLDSLFGIRPTRDRDAARRAVAGFEGRRGDYTPRTPYEKNYIAGNPDQIEAARVQVAVSALGALAAELGRVGDARKTIILVAEALGRPARSRGREYLTTVDSITRSANASNVSIYAVDPGMGATDTDAGPGRDEAIQALTASTDGAVVAGADLGAGLDRLARDSREYYLLTYRSAHKEDGHFHPVQVRVRNTAVKVRARSGYWAPSPDDALRAKVLAQASQPAPVARVEPVRHISPLIRPWFGLSRGEAGKTRVTFVWEAAGRVPGDRLRHYPSRLILTALAADDSVIFQGPVLPSGSVAAEERGTTVRAVFDAPTGNIRLRMQVEDEAAQVMDSDVRDLAVRDWRAAVALGTPELLRARTAREFRSLAPDPEAAPVASREFSRTERLLIRFVVYAPEGIEKAVAARLLSRSGQEMRELNVDVGAMPDGRNQVDLPLAGLAPGEYLIDLEVTSKAGQAHDRLAFRVTN